MQDLVDAKRELADRLLKPDSYSNVLAVGIGKKIEDGQPGSTNCVRIYVQSKLPKDQLGRTDLLPNKDSLGGSTDVIEIRSLRRSVKLVSLQKGALLSGSPIRLNTSAPNLNSQAV